MGGMFWVAHRVSGVEVLVLQHALNDRLSEPRPSGSGLSHRVDNKDYSYVINAIWDNPALTATTLRNVRLTYTITQPLP